MANGPRYAVKFRRRREGKTDYRKRLALLKSGKTRLVVRRTNSRTIVQFVDFDKKGDTVRAQATSAELKAFGWTSTHANTPASYLAGMLAARRAVGAGIEDAVLDVGLGVPVKGGGLFAAMRGAVDGGVEVAHGEGVLPSDDRVKGKHLKGPTGTTFDDAKKKIMESKA